MLRIKRGGYKLICLNLISELLFVKKKLFLEEVIQFNSEIFSRLCLFSRPFPLNYGDVVFI